MIKTKEQHEEAIIKAIEDEEIFEESGDDL